MISVLDDCIGVLSDILAYMLKAFLRDGRPRSFESKLLKGIAVAIDDCTIISMDIFDLQGLKEE